jgi:hypothetical protein
MYSENLKLKLALNYVLSCFAKERCIPVIDDLKILDSSTEILWPLKSNLREIT